MNSWPNLNGSFAIGRGPFAMPESSIPSFALMRYLTFETQDAINRLARSIGKWPPDAEARRGWGRHLAIG